MSHLATPNKVVHFEIPADDTARAQKFYESSFGWRIQQFPGMDYFAVGTTPTNDKQEPTEVGGINGGMTKRGGAVTHPVFTVDVPDIEKALATIEKNGGSTVLTKQPVGDMGFIGYFKDSEGNVVGLWQNAA